MATTTRIQRPQEREHGRATPLLEVLYNLPKTLRDGRISWLMLPGEETPSTIVIYKDLTPEHLIQLATWRIVHLDMENRLRNRFRPGSLSGVMNSEQARELAAEAFLGDSESIVPYLEKAYPPQEVEPVRTMSCTASVVISRPAEAIFAYLSDQRHHLFLPGQSGEQGEEVTKHTYRFFGIPVTLNSRELQVKETHRLTPDPIGLGTIFEQIGTLNGRTQTSKVEIIEYEPPRIIAFKSSPIPIRSRTILTPARENTNLTMTITMGNGCHPLIGFIWTPMAKQDLQAGLKRLKVTLESPEE